MTKLSALAFKSTFRTSFWVLFLFLHTLIFIWHFPIQSLSLEPATGGDTGSHFYTLWRLHNSGYRVWDPGHLMGELQLVHYFPIPFLIMWLLAWVLPLGLAFNVGIMLPIFLFPLVAFYMFRVAGQSVSNSLLAWLGALLFFYNESYSIWGGNGLSTLAGQFAHLYALIFLLFFIGLAARPLYTYTRLAGLAILTGLICATHSYVFVFLPPLFLALLYLKDREKLPFKKIFWFYFLSGFLGVLNGLWFLAPQIEQSPWVYRFAMRWEFDTNWQSWAPPYLIAILALSILLATIARLLNSNKIFLPLRQTRHRLLELLATLVITGAIYFYIFPKLGLIDARSLPQIYLGLTLIASYLISEFTKFIFKKNYPFAIAIFLIFGLFYNANQSTTYTHWASWNFSGWSQKPLFNEARQVMNILRGSYSEGRVLYEHSPDLVNSGTTRIFELLPAFAGRATLESLYTESTHTAFITHDLQARISAEPSCPDRHQPCPRLDINSLETKLNLIGVSDIILISTESKNLIQSLSFLDIKYVSPQFSIVSLKSPAPLIEIIHSPIQSIPKKNWQEAFQHWYREYPHSSPHYLTFSPGNTPFSELKPSTLPPPTDCQATIQVEINQLHLSTNCPDHPHLIKFAYSPFLQASNHTPLMPISPGFIWLQPKVNNLDIEFRPPWRWHLAIGASLLGLAICVLLILKENHRKLRRAFISKDEV